MDKEVVTELIQDKFNTKNIKRELHKILKGEDREEMINNYNELEQKLGGNGASEKTAKLIISSLEK